MILKFGSKPFKIIKRFRNFELSALILPAQKEYFPQIGNREIVGYGTSGAPDYFDHTLFPYPAIRWQEYDENECEDWSLLTLEEKKKLYRISYRLTIAELTSGNCEWLYTWALVFTLLGFALLMATYVRLYIVGPELPKTLTEEGRMISLYRKIYSSFEPVTGVASKWDYDKLMWKEE